MSRIRRDTRYTKDKSPFRDHAWLGWRYPGEGRGEGFHMYWGFGPDWLGWGCGCYYTDKPLMDALRLHIRRESDDVRRCLKALDGRFEPYGEDYKKLAVPDDVLEDLRFLYVKKYFGFERNGTQADWALLHTRGMADVIAADLSRDGSASPADAPDARPGGTGRTGSGARAGSEGARGRAGRCGEARKAGCSFRRRV